MSLSRWQKLSERMTAKVVLLAEAVDTGETAGAAGRAVPADKVLSLIFTQYQMRFAALAPRRQASVAVARQRNLQCGCGVFFWSPGARPTHPRHIHRCTSPARPAAVEPLPSAGGGGARHHLDPRRARSHAGRSGGGGAADAPAPAAPHA